VDVYHIYVHIYIYAFTHTYIYLFIKVLAFSRRKKILQLACGRKHYVLLTTGMYGPYCYIKNGFYEKTEGKNENYECTAGFRIKFCLQGMDLYIYIYMCICTKF
jgi:hypothetical protein